MQGMNVDLTTIVAIWLGAAVLIIPLLGLTARFGLVPILDAVTRMRGSRPAAGLDEETERRFAGLEARLSRACQQIAELSSQGEPSLR